MYQIFLRIYQIYLRMYLGFQSPFRDEEQLAITSQGSLNNQMDHEKGYRGPNSPRIGLPIFFKDIPKVPKSVLR